MGNKDSFLMPCCDYNLPSNRGCIEDFGLNSTGPIKAFRKKCSVATSETISINPIMLGSNRSSVTEFVVNKGEVLTENFIKSPDREQVYSVPCSPGRYRPMGLYGRNGKGEGKNIVKEVRSRSLVSSPQQSIGPDYSLKLKEDMKNFIFCEKSSKRKNRSGNNNNVKIDKIIRKRLYS